MAFWGFSHWIALYHFNRISETSYLWGKKETFFWVTVLKTENLERLLCGPHGRWWKWVQEEKVTFPKPWCQRADGWDSGCWHIPFMRIDHHPASNTFIPSKDMPPVTPGLLRRPRLSKVLQHLPTVLPCNMSSTYENFFGVGGAHSCRSSAGGTLF